jgi:hypothetical protein
MFSGWGQLTLLSLFGGALFGGDAPEKVSALEIHRVRPTKAERQIELTNLSYFFAKKRFGDDLIHMKIGATATHAHGSIIQLQGRIEDGTFGSVELESPALGVGPTVSAGLRVLETRSTRLSLEAVGSVMVYDRGFPAGGSWYNGMVQAGPSLSIGLADARSLTLGVRWTHISNGQGLGPHNPSFDGRGVYLQYEQALGWAGSGGY